MFVNGRQVGSVFGMSTRGLSIPIPTCEPFPECLSTVWPAGVPHPCEPFPDCVPGALPTLPAGDQPPPPEPELEPEEGWSLAKGIMIAAAPSILAGIVLYWVTRQ